MSEIKFLFVMDTDVGSPIDNGEGITVLGVESAGYVTAQISNELYRSEVYAPEVNWYVRYTCAPKEEQKEVLKQLYAMRAIRYEHAPKKTYTIVVDRSVMIVGESEEALALVQSAKHYFEVTHIVPKDLLHLEGKFGAFKARIHQEIEEEGERKEHEIDVTCGQLVLCDQQSELYKSRGVECVMDYTDVESLLRRIRDRIGYYEYKNPLTYDALRCVYHHNAEATCTHCVDICPTFGLTSDATRQELIFSALDCTACGKCVSVCFEAAIDFAPFCEKAFFEVAQLCKDRHIILIAEPYLKAVEGCEIPSGYVPFVVETDHFLSVKHFRVLAHESSNGVLFYAPEISHATHEALMTFNAQEGKEVITLIHDKEALEKYFLTCNNKDTQKDKV
jgi:ferredoxin